MVDASEIKNKIISLIKERGPQIPMKIANEMRMNSIFTSAFLSELINDNELKTSTMRVGGSPIYFIPGQESQLEKYGKDYLKSREKDAFFLLLKNSYLKDSEQEPAIRVALRTIKDFAIPLDKNGELYWKYVATPEIQIEEKTKELIPIITSITEIKENPEEKLIDEEIFTEKKEFSLEEKTLVKKEKIKREKVQRKKSSSKSSKTNEVFFNKVKEYLNSQGTEILDILGFSKDSLNLKIKENEKELLLLAYKKKRIDEKDIIKAFKKSQENNLPYKILGLGEPAKKITEFLEASKTLESIERIE